MYDAAYTGHLRERESPSFVPAEVISLAYYVPITGNILCVQSRLCGQVDSTSAGRGSDNRVSSVAEQALS